MEIQDGKVEFKITSMDGIIRNEVMEDNEEIQLDKDVKIKVVKISGDKRILLGISAPQDLAVVRIPTIVDDK